MAADRPLFIGLPSAAGLTSMTNQQFIDSIEKATPGPLFGFIIFSSATPDVATYPWLARCVWADTTAPAAIVLKQYQTGTGLWTAIGLGGITDVSQIADNLITPVKLSNASASAYYVLHTSAGNVPEWVPLSSILTNDTVPLNAINNTAASASAILQSIGGITQWVDYATVAAAIVASITSYDIQKLTGGLADGMLITDGSGTKAFITIANFLSTKIADNSLNPLKIDSSAATDLSVLTKKDGVSKFVVPLYSKEFIQVDPSGAMPATGANVKRTFTHGLGVRPKHVEVRLICTSAEHGYSVDDEIHPTALAVGIAGTWGHINITTTEIHVLLRTGLGTFYNSMSDAAPPAAVTLTAANWKLKVYAYA